QNDEHVQNVNIPAIRDPDTGSPLPATLKVTLVWSDLPGEMLQNDLDLIIVAANGKERRGNMGTATGPDDFDRVKHVEQAVWKGIATGNATIIVRTFRIIAPQPYAYVWRISDPKHD